jgi:uroporphyrinogen-III synthase
VTTDLSALIGARVLIPRAAKRGATLAEDLTAAGAEPLAVPLIAIEPPEDWTPFDAAIGSLARGEYDWLVVTSLSTVDALAERAELVGLDLAALLGSPHAPRSDGPPALVAAVGAATARELARHDVPVALVPKMKQWAGGLVAEFPHPSDDSKPVLVPQGDLADDTVLDGLGALGWEPHSVRAYRTVAAPDPDPEVAELLAAGAIDAIVLTSGSTARRLVEVFGIPPSSTIVCCIGPRTAEVARECGLTVTAVSTMPSYQGIMEVLSSALADRDAER